MTSTAHIRNPFKHGTRRWVDSEASGPSAEDVVFISNLGSGCAFRYAQLIRVSRHPAVTEYARGKEGECPDQAYVDLADRIVVKAISNSTNPDIHVDFEGALSFDLRLPNGQLLLAELFIDGTLDVSVYDDDLDKWVVSWPHATESQFSSLF